MRCSPEKTVALFPEYGTLQLTGVSHHYVEAYYQSETGDVTVVRTYKEEDAALSEVFVNPVWASLLSEDSHKETAVRGLLQQKLSFEEQLASLTKLFEDSNPSAVLQGWFFVEKIVLMPTLVVRLAYPLFGKNRHQPFDFAAHPRTSNVLEVRSLEPALDHVEVTHSDKHGLQIAWDSSHAGFGCMTVGVSEKGSLVLDTEHMGKAFAMQVMRKLIEDAELES